MTYTQTWLQERAAKLDARRQGCQRKRIKLSCREPFCRESPERGGRHVEHMAVYSCCHRTCSCERCRWIRSKRAAKRYEAGIENMKIPRLVTLTFPRRFREVSKENAHWCAERFKLLQQKLRRHKTLVQPAIGEPFEVTSDLSFRHYLKVLELAYNEYPDANGEYHSAYHYHYHIIYDGAFLPWSVLQAYWKQISGSDVARIEMPKKRLRAVRYCLKYVSKGMFLDGGPDSEEMSSFDYYRIARSIRFVCGFGLIKVKIPPFYYCPFCLAPLTFEAYEAGSGDIFKDPAPRKDYENLSFPGRPAGSGAAQRICSAY